MRVIERSGVRIHVVTDHDDAVRVIEQAKAAFDRGFTPSLDFETTTLMPWHGGHIRISSIAIQDDEFVTYVIDHRAINQDYAAGFRALGQHMRSLAWAVFNAGFEMRWFEYFVGERTFNFYDVGLLSKAVLGGRPLGLADMAKRDLRVVLNKELQVSDWSADRLNDDQYFYAGYDALITAQLYDYWRKEVANRDNAYNGFFILNDAVRGTAQMEDHGLLLDIDYHATLLALWQRRSDTLKSGIRRITDEATLPNINSDKQIGSVLSSVLDEASLAAWPRTDSGQLSVTRDTMIAASSAAPYPLSRWLAAIVAYRRVEKYRSTYGSNLVSIQQARGRLTARFNIAQAVTGRYSSSGPNLQNIPRSPAVRRAFVARPNGILVLADYKSIELRVLAVLSNDPAMSHDAVYGDMHAKMAADTLRVKLEAFNKQLKEKSAHAKLARNRAKVGNFRKIYGAGARAIANSMRSTTAEAQEFMRAFDAAYPRAAHYKIPVYEKMMHDGFISVHGGRDIYVSKDNRQMPIAANFPIQGAAGNVMYRAIYHLEEAIYRYNEEERLRGGPQHHVEMLATVHDELLSEVIFDDDFIDAYGEDECWETARDVMALQSRAMTQGWLDVFPGSDTNNLLEAEVGTSWADKP